MLSANSASGKCRLRLPRPELAAATTTTLRDRPSPPHAGRAKYTLTSWSRGNKVSPVPPHPAPLPWGEGAPQTIVAYAWTLRLVAARRMVLPLPKGEGRGEGEPTAGLENRLRQIPRRPKILRRVRSSKAARRGAGAKLRRGAARPDGLRMIVILQRLAHVLHGGIHAPAELVGERPPIRRPTGGGLIKLMAFAHRPVIHRNLVVVRQ